MRFRTFIIPVMLAFFIVLIYGIFSKYISPGHAVETPAGSATSSASNPGNGSQSEQKNGTLTGTLTLSKDCPAGTDPSACKPSPQEYSTRRIYIYASNRITLFETLTPDGNGSFSATLPAGSYYADMDRQSVESIQGIPAYFDISANGTTELKISVSSGLK